MQKTPNTQNQQNAKTGLPIQTEHNGVNSSVKRPEASRLGSKPKIQVLPRAQGVKIQVKQRIWKKTTNSTSFFFWPLHTSWDTYTQILNKQINVILKLKNNSRYKGYNDLTAIQLALCIVWEIIIPIHSLNSVNRKVEYSRTLASFPITTVPKKFPIYRIKIVSSSEKS